MFPDIGRTRSKRTAKRLAAVFTAFGFLVLLLSTVVGLPAFTYYHVALPVEALDDKPLTLLAAEFRLPGARDAEQGLFPNVAGAATTSRRIDAQFPTMPTST